MWLEWLGMLETLENTELFPNHIPNHIGSVWLESFVKMHKQQKEVILVSSKKDFIHCYKCGYDFYPSCVGQCPHPVVNKRYGETICIYCCRKCRHHTTMKYCGAVGCSYKNEKGSDVV